MVKTDLVTIGITCFNAQENISRAIKSAVIQTWPNTEIIIVDDKSNDDSVSVIKNLIKKHSHMFLVEHKKNQGPAASRQTVLNHAKGDFIAFFDDDDESLSERLEKQVTCITSYESLTGEDLVACYASGKRIYPNGYEIALPAIGSKPDVPHGPEVANRLLFYGANSSFFYGAGTPTCALMARKETYDKIGGFDPSFRRVEDIDFAIRLALAGGHFIGCQEQLFIQYATTGEDKVPEKNRDAEIQLVEKNADYLKSINRYYYARKWPLLRYYHFKKKYLPMLFVLIDLFLHHPFKTVSHLFSTGPKRILHEIKMNKRVS